MSTPFSAVHFPDWSVQREGRAEVAQLTNPVGFIFKSLRGGQEMLRDFSFSVNMHYDFCCPLTYRQLLPQKCYRSYWAASSLPGGLRVGSIRQRELLLCCSSQHHGRVKCFSERAACSSAVPQPEGCSLSPLSVPPGPFFLQSTATRSPGPAFSEINLCRSRGPTYFVKAIDSLNLF